MSAWHVNGRLTPHTPLAATDGELGSLSTMNRTERLAKMVIERVIPGGTVHYHTEQASGLHDFDLTYSDGGTVPVEVTAAADRQLSETVAAIESRRNGGRFIEARACHNGWLVHPLPDANINRLRAQLDVFLARIEAVGVSKFFAWTDAAECKPVRQILTELRVEAGRVFAWKGGRQIGLVRPGQGGRVTADHVQRAVELEASKRDNRLKLARTGAREAHLVVCIESTNFLPWVSLVDGIPPSTGPSSPPEITDVWAIARTRTSGEAVVWRANSAEGWILSRRLSLPTEPRPSQAIN